MLIQATSKLRKEFNLRKLEPKEKISLFSWHARAAVLKVELELGEHEAWRKIIVPLSYNFRELHRIIQKLYNWQDYHLHEFFIYSEEKDDTKWLNNSEYHRDGFKAILNLTMNLDNLEYNMYEMNYQDQDFELIY